jgi:hypothetical protein
MGEIFSFDKSLLLQITKFHLFAFSSFYISY